MDWHFDYFNNCIFLRQVCLLFKSLKTHSVDSVTQPYGHILYHRYQHQN